MTDDEALLLEIRKTPRDDTLRLAYADWLDENTQQVPCTAPRCKDGKVDNFLGIKGEFRCDECMGTGTVPDGKNEEAEFIRLQIQLSKESRKSPDHWTDEDRRLRDREERLAERIIDRMGAAYPSYRRDFRKAQWFTRGFVATLHTTLRKFYGVACLECGGEGVAGHHYDRGMLGVCQACRGKGGTPGDAKKVFSSHPITEVRLADRSADATPGQYQWWRSAGAFVTISEQPTVLPQAIFDLLPAEYGRYDDDVYFEYENLPDAYDALSDACVTYGRRLAGLPDL